VRHVRLASTNQAMEKKYARIARQAPIRIQQGLRHALNVSQEPGNLSTAHHRVFYAPLASTRATRVEPWNPRVQTALCTRTLATAAGNCPTALATEATRETTALNAANAAQGHGRHSMAHRPAYCVCRASTRARQLRSPRRRVMTAPRKATLATAVV
jgi:hypothetical protein